MNKLDEVLGKKTGLAVRIVAVLYVLFAVVMAGAVITVMSGVGYVFYSVIKFLGVL